jgi:hypothetical protein
MHTNGRAVTNGTVISTGVAYPNAVKRLLAASAAHADVEQFARKALQRAVDAGRELSAAKAELPHGQWIPHLEKYFGASVSTAETYMLIDALVRYMPDVVAKISGLTIASALWRMKLEFHRRHEAKGLASAVYTAELIRLARAFGRQLAWALEGLGEEGWRAWLAELGISEAAAREWIEVSAGPELKPNLFEQVFPALPKDLREILLFSKTLRTEPEPSYTLPEERPAPVDERLLPEERPPNSQILGISPKPKISRKAVLKAIAARDAAAKANGASSPRERVR